MTVGWMNGHGIMAADGCKICGCDLYLVTSWFRDEDGNVRMARVVCNTCRTRYILDITSASLALE